MSDTKPLGQQMAEAMARSIRSAKWNLETALQKGWTREQFAHWVATGQEPVLKDAQPSIVPSGRTIRR